MIVLFLPVILKEEEILNIPFRAKNIVPIAPKSWCNDWGITQNVLLVLYCILRIRFLFSKIKKKIVVTKNILSKNSNKCNNESLKIFQFHLVFCLFVSLWQIRHRIFKVRLNMTILAITIEYKLHSVVVFVASLKYLHEICFQTSTLC